MIQYTQLNFSIQVRGGHCSPIRPELSITSSAPSDMSAMYQNFSKEELKQLVRVRALNESGELEQLLHEATASILAQWTQGSMNDSSMHRLTTPVLSAKEELDQFGAIALTQSMTPHPKKMSQAPVLPHQVGYSFHAGTEIRMPEGIHSLKQWAPQFVNSRKWQSVK